MHRNQYEEISNQGIEQKLAKATKGKRKNPSCLPLRPSRPSVQGFLIDDLIERTQPIVKSVPNLMLLIESV